MAHTNLLKRRGIFRGELWKTMLLGMPLHLFCPGCGKHIPSTMPWVCGYCDQEHAVNHGWFNFLNRCKQCLRRPKSVACPHCLKLWCLDHDNDTEHPARKVGQPAITLPLEVLETQRRAREIERSERKQDLAFRIEEAQLAAQLAELQKKIEESKPKTEAEQLATDFARQQARLLGMHEIVAAQRRQNEEKYRNDPDMLRRANDFLDHWKEQQM
jgi:hypothetical protein